MTTIYLDDEDEGLARETSHPHFVEIAPDSFFDETDEFSPFGNDDGNDALRAMEEWFEDRAPGSDPVEFLTELLDVWDLEVPEDAFDLDDAGLVELVREDEGLERRLLGVARATVAASLAQVKIAGEVSSALLDAGKRALRVQRVLAADTSRYPDWPHRADALRGIDETSAALESL